MRRHIGILAMMPLETVLAAKKNEAFFPTGGPLRRSFVEPRHSQPIPFYTPMPFFLDQPTRLVLLCRKMQDSRRR